jgi:hypothetical protein
MTIIRPRFSGVPNGLLRPAFFRTFQRYAHLSHDTLLAATNSVNTALGGMFMPMVSASPVEIGLSR